MATAMRSTTFLRLGFRQVSSLLFHGPLSPAPTLGLGLGVGRASLVRLRCSAAEAGDDGGRKVSARLALTQQVLRDAEERAASAGSDPAPKITLDRVTVNFARSGGPGGQNVNKVNTKVDMRFNVKEAHWLGERIKERILQTEKNRINKDGELVISSTKTRTQKGNIEDALQKLQAIIDAASYVPPPPSEEQKKKIEKICCCGFHYSAAAAERKRLQKKKVLSQKKEFRRNRTSWD
uniref:Prokaryotic-type class I peptide chain release factors domain-containing protein n=1 Tax=Oryza punctata TaxID=4537 RepID=A0A0E0KBA6_ORYPU